MCLTFSLDVFSIICSPGVRCKCANVLRFFFASVLKHFWAESFTDFFFLFCNSHIFLCIEKKKRTCMALQCCRTFCVILFSIYRFERWMMMHERVCRCRVPISFFSSSFPSFSSTWQNVLAYIGVVVVQTVRGCHAFRKRTSDWVCECVAGGMEDVVWRNKWRHQQSINFPLTSCFRQ